MTFGLSAGTIAAIGSVAAPVIGGMLGGQGSSSSSETQRVMDPRMNPFVFGGDGQRGILDYARNQMQQSQSPGRQAERDGIRARGMQLMGGTVAGNPFASGYTGGSNFGAAGMGMQPAPMAPVATPAAPAPATQTSQVPSLDEIMAEINRRQQAMAYQQYIQEQFGGAGAGGADGPGVGNNANGDAAGVGAGPM